MKIPGSLSTLFQSSYCTFSIANMWKFVLLLALSHGASSIAPGAFWMQETLKCSELRVVVEPNKNLVETPEALDQMCKQQDEYYRCLERMFSLGDPDNLAEFNSEIGKEISIFTGLCSPDHTWRTRYLEFAPCINKQQTDFCFTPAFLGADGVDQDYCILHEKMANCIAATLSMKCSMEAGRLFHYLLKLKGDNCQSEKIACQDSELGCEGNPNTSVIVELIDKALKVNSVKDQNDAEYVLLPDGASLLHAELQDVNDYTSNSLEIENLVTDSHIDGELNSEDIEHVTSEDYESVSEVITSVLDALDEN